MGNIFLHPTPFAWEVLKMANFAPPWKSETTHRIIWFQCEGGSSKFDTFSIFPTMLYNCSCSIGVRTTSHTLFTSRISATSNVNLLPKSPFTFVCNWFWLQTFLRNHFIGWMAITIQVNYHCDLSIYPLLLPLLPSLLYPVELAEVWLNLWFHSQSWYNIGHSSDMGFHFQRANP